MCVCVFLILTMMMNSGGSSSNSSRGPGSAPLRMETQEQRKLGYGGDDGGMGNNNNNGGDGDDDGEEEDGWNPGGDGGEPSTIGLAILLIFGAWALWEYKRPGGTLNPQTKIDQQRARYEKAYKAKYGYFPGEKPAPKINSGGTGKVNFN